MRTLVLTLEYPPQTGGIASYVYNYAARALGQVVILADKSAGQQEFDANKPWKTYRKNLSLPFFWLTGWMSTIKVWRIVSQEQIETLHVHQVLPLGYLAVILRFLRVVPSFTVFLHGSDWQLAVAKWRKRKLMLWVLKQAKEVIVNSEFMRRQVSDLLPKAAIKVVHPCPAEEFFLPLDAKRVEAYKEKMGLLGKKVIISVSRLVERKGFVRLARLLPEIIKRVPNCVWLIVGDGPEKKNVIDLIQKSNLQNCARYLGAVDFVNLPIYYSLADLFVLLTHKDSDGVDEAWGTVFLEAAAIGLPAVAGRSGGVEEAVLNLQTGVIVDANQDAAVVNTIVDLLNNQLYARQLGAAAKERATKDFRWEKEITKIYE